MVGLDYFLNKKRIKKIRKSLDNDRYFANVFSSVNENINLAFEKNLASDRYLFDYAKAFSIPKNSLAWEEIQMLEILSLLIIDGSLEETSPKKIRKLVTEIYGGKKPKNQDERKIWNLIEALDLIETEKFVINEDNYELLMHIMFRNLGYNLDLKTEFYRNPKTKSQLKNLLNPALVDQELKSLLDYIAALDENDLSGFSQATIIFFSFLYISPYQRNNVIVAFLMSKWFLFTIDTNHQSENLFPNLMYSLTQHWKTFLDLTNACFAKDLNIDAPAELLARCTIDGINSKYRLNYLETWIKEDARSNQDLFVDEIDKMILLSLMGLKTEIWKISKVMQVFKVQNRSILSRKEVVDFIDKLVTANILTKNTENQAENYALNNQNLKRIRNLLRD